ncbi:membrane intrinsic sulfatase [Sulfurimonas gotlandica GD1]|uniref:Membrane intrinsic sulfatase n=1 Tax=Sulfurimonas gotlandica (strain DSM 19862 / JCM 16533 / GD1) TaxID=929558 RepID=B6BIW6_SULGG|nr:alkaline phosphatase family protein [Sulfurimonas gotlandica]EDZ63092.1 sulfatase domain protein [Sulfurimonas gotlandica GD1]EHP30477.1 membrane intrinsic sulfatase [Sulfurimonas gotlandica GD1]
MRKNQLTQILALVIFSFIVLMAIRLTLYNFYIDDFSNLTTGEFYTSLLMGFRVDMITIFTFSSLFILTLLFIKKPKYRAKVALLWAILLNIIFILSFSDVLYYDYIHRHISNEIFNLSDDMDIIFGMAFGSMLPFTLGAILISISFLYLVFKLFSSELESFISGKKLLILTIVTILVLFIGIRNSFAGKSFGSSDAYAVNKVSSGNLALNGFFTIYRTAKKTAKHNLVDLDEAIQTTQDALKTSNAPFVNKEYPLLRQYSKKDKEQYNVVIVLLESFGAEHIDGFTKYKELNVTPYFKRLSNEGLKFTNFYSNGYRSIFGITSMFTGVTIPAGAQYLGKGLELSNLSYLGSVAKDNGYSTISMQAANRRSYRVDSVSALAGFDEYYGAQDMPNVEEVDAGREPLTGTYDFNMLDFYHKKLNSMKEPFLGFAFTDTTHSDYHLPSKKYERYPHDLKNYNGALNAYIYADDSIRRFIEGAKKEPWFDRTIFIFTSDHGSGDALNQIAREYRPDDKPLTSIEHFRIPLIIYAPKIFKPMEVKTLGGHNDIFPTIVDMLGWKADIATMGSSLFDEDVNERLVYFYAGNLIGLITNNGYIKYNFKDIVEQVGSQENIQKMKKLLFSVDTAEAGLLEKNRWAK